MKVRLGAVKVIKQTLYIYIYIYIYIIIIKQGKCVINALKNCDIAVTNTISASMKLTVKCTNISATLMLFGVDNQSSSHPKSVENALSSKLSPSPHNAVIIS